MSHRTKLLDSLASGRRLCDDCLSDTSGVKPRQSVRRACITLRDQMIVSRLTEECEACGRMKVTNALLSAKQPSLTAQFGQAVPTSKVRKPMVAAEPAPDRDIKSQSKGTTTPSELGALIARFIRTVVTQDIELYNEFSLQHELGIFLRSEYPRCRVQFERNVSYFSSDVEGFTKREIDIVVFSKDKTDLKLAIELKYPRNGQYPEQMFSFCKDIAFAEELRQAGFHHTALLVFADDRGFYSGSGDGIYGFWRTGEVLTGIIHKPTGDKAQSVEIKGAYDISWVTVCGDTRYALIEVGW